MKKLILAIPILLIFALLMSPVSADGVVTYEPIPIVTDIPTFNPYEDEVFGNLVTNDSEGNDTIDLWAMMLSIIEPFKSIFGAYIFVIIYGLFLYNIYANSRGTETIVVVLGVTLSAWIALMPPQTYFLLVLIFVLSVTAIIFKLFKRR